MWHEQRFKDKPEKVQRWRAALTHVSGLSGWDSTMYRPDSKLVDEIVQDVIKRLNDISSFNYYEGLFGIDLRIKDVESLLSPDSLDIRVVGIWGMGGIGKTTLARALFYKISHEYEASCFIENVREQSYHSDGLCRLKEQLLYELLNERIEIGVVDIIPKSIQYKIQSKKVLIVLDDVNYSKQFKFLIRRIDAFGLGSRVIITTRNSQVLDECQVGDRYRVKELDYENSFQLFCCSAFGQKQSPEDYMELLKRFVDYAKGIPLALKVLVSFLAGKTRKLWENSMLRLGELPNRHIVNVMKISFDQLDPEEQGIFLDIVCFFKGEDRNHAMEVLSACYLSAHSGLDALIGRSLITISSNNKLEVHGLLEEMGKEIVRGASEHLGHRSRLWKHGDACHVLRHRIGSEVIECIKLDMSKINEFELHPEAFRRMTNLKLLKFYMPCPWKFREDVDMSRVHLTQRLKYLSDELRYLHWDMYPSKTLPLKFNPMNLVEINLPYSRVERLWKGTKHAPKLKSINLCYSEHLIDFPNFSEAPDLEKIYLKDCKSLYAVPYIQHLTNLRILNLSGCESLRSFPSNIEFRSLITLDLSYCSSLTKFPQISGNIKYLYLNETEIKELPSSIGHIKGLKELVLEKCENLETISSSICNLTSLEKVDFSGCSKLESLPENLGNLVHLKEFRANRTALSRLPSSIPCWKELICLGLASSNFTEIPKHLCSLSLLEHLDLSGNNFRVLPPGINKLSQLRHLVLRDNSMLQVIPELPRQVTHLDASNCKQLQSLVATRSCLVDLDESEPKNICECFENLPVGIVEFKCTNCPKMKENLVDTQQIIQHIAYTALRLYYQKGSDETPRSSLILSGSEIPGWFDHKSSGSLITISPLSRLCNSSFIGFALSVVIAFEESYNGDSILVKCTYKFENSCEEFQWDCFVKLTNSVIKSDLIVIGYSPCSISLLKGDYKSVSFAFCPLRITDGSPAKGCTVKWCGVHLLSLNKSQPSASNELNIETSEDLEEIMMEDSFKRKFHGVNTSGGEIGVLDEDKMEPQPKKNRQEMKASCKRGVKLFASFFRST